MNSTQTTVTKMNKATANKIARHLCRPVQVVASGNSGIIDCGGWPRGGGSGKTYGFKVAKSADTYTVKGEGGYSRAVAARREWIEDMVSDLLDGSAPEWADMDFKW